jgi:hypothetical protein
MDAIRRADEIHEKSAINENGIKENELNPDEDKEEYMRGLEDLYASVSHPLYRRSKVSMTSAFIVILTMCSTHGISNTFVDELLNYLSTTLLPTGNSLPSKHYAAKTIVRRLGLSYSMIHACIDGHVIFRGQFESLDNCPTCNKSWWIPESTTIPQKVIRNFLLIPRLKKLYRSSMISEMLKWHFGIASTNGEMASVVDSPTLKCTDIIDPLFVEDRRNIRMGLPLDGMNPFSMQRTTHSTWPVLIFFYNLPPWMGTKKFFISLTTVISKKEAPTSQNIKYSSNLCTMS